VLYILYCLLLDSFKTYYCDNVPSSMVSTVPFVSEYVYEILRVRIYVEDNALIRVVVVFHYGDRNEAFRIGGFGLPSETMVACALRHKNHPAWIHFSMHECFYIY
jgi:hypothetical protein